jgi:hypothetical protein
VLSGKNERPHAFFRVFAKFCGIAIEIVIAITYLLATTLRFRKEMAVDGCANATIQRADL